MYLMDDNVDMQVILGAALGVVFGLMVAVLLWVARRNPKAIKRVALSFMRRPSQSLVSPYGKCKLMRFNPYNRLQAPRRN